MNKEVAVAHAAEVEAAHHADEHSAEFGNENMKFGMWLFLASEVMFFSVLIAAFILNRFRYPEEHSLLNIPLTSLNTFLLLTSSFTVVRGLAAIQSGNYTTFVRSIALTGLLGTIFLAIQYIEYTTFGHEGLTISSSPFGTSFFTLTGFHGTHVLIGVIWCGVVFWNALNGKYTQHNHFGVELFGLYWHFVDVVWILIFTIVYLIR